MNNTILHLENNGQRIIGNLNIHLSDFAEVQIISPFFGFLLQGSRDTVNENDGQRQYSLAEFILRRCYELCRIMQEEHQVITSEFLTLMETLVKFNNKDTEDYQRNRNELMKVFMNRFFQPVEHASCNYIYERDAIFNFLASFFIKNGRTATLNIRTLYERHVSPPTFNILETLLKEYLAKTESEKIELLVQQILSRKRGKYDWFIQQEFLQANQGLTEESN